MLVLSRRVGESILLHGGPLAEPVEIAVSDIRGDSVRIGIEAPREIKVHRREVYEHCRKEGIKL